MQCLCLGKKAKYRIHKFKEKRYLECIYQNVLDEGYLQHDFTKGNFRYLPREGEVHDKTLDITKYPKLDSYQRGLASMAYKSFDKISRNIKQMLSHLLPI